MYYVVALCMGLSIALQAPINAALGRSLQTSPLIAALISFFIGTLCLLLIAFYSGALNLGIFQALGAQNWWKFLGGVLGAFFVFGTTLLAPQIGLLNMFLLVLFGQLITSLLLDSIGAFGLEPKPILWNKIIGLGVILVGLFVFFYREIRG